MIIVAWLINHHINIIIDINVSISIKYNKLVDYQ